MKKIIVLFIFLFCMLFLKSPFSLSMLSQNYDATHTFYSTQKNVQNKNAHIVQNGNGFLISISSKNAANILCELNGKNIQGESFCFDGTEDDALKLLHKLDAQIVKKECFNNFKIVYAYSPKLSKHVLMNDKKINIQIAIKNEVITIGTPIILGSY